MSPPVWADGRLQPATSKPATDGLPGGRRSCWMRAASASSWSIRCLACSARRRSRSSAAATSTEATTHVAGKMDAPA